jgi:hypothetical protein
LAIAQAAVVLVAVWFLSGPRTRTGPELAMNEIPRVVSGAMVATSKIEIDAGELPLLRSDGAGRVTVAPRDALSSQGSSAVDSAFAVLNALEAMAE